MSIKSDKWIKRQCLPPTHLLVGNGPNDFKQVWAGITHTEAQLADLVKRYHAVAVTDQFLKEINWKPMISPFEPAQVREKEVDMSAWNSGGAVAGIPPTHSLGAMLREDKSKPLTEKVISYGVTSYGYDVRCTDQFKIFTNINSQMIDPKAFNDRIFVDHKGPHCIIPPNSFALATTVEYFRIPRNVLTICLGKSTYARCGIIVNVTPLEPEWEGQVTLEFSNTTNLPAKIYANEGVAQMLFLESDEECEVSYKDRGGKYQGQRGVTLPKA
jgi:dCTP deaminase